jgi:octaprenyl-diphosphate synthase
VQPKSLFQEPGITQIGTIASRHDGAEHVRSRLAALTDLLRPDLDRVDDLLASCLPPDSACARAAADLVAAGGKRLRPAVVLITARWAVDDSSPSPHALSVAAAVEMLHAATLLHDDVIDDAIMRRGRPAARCTWGNTVSVIAGDLLLVRALSLIGRVGLRPLDLLTTATLDDLVLGEVEQLERRGRVDLDIPTFERIALRKTASLFVLAAVGGALLAGAPQADLDALRRFASWAGIAFQLSDDILDLCGSADDLGKAVGQDLATGAVTLPIADILASDEDLRRDLRACLSPSGAYKPSREVAERILQTAHRSGALQRSRRQLDRYLDRASSTLAHLTSPALRSALGPWLDLVAGRVVSRFPGVAEARP